MTRRGHVWDPTFKAIQQMHLAQRAAQVFEGWARARARKLGGQGGLPKVQP
jgi:hypothetical protein